MSTLNSLQKQRESLTAQLLVLNKELATKKSIGGRRKTKKAIKQVNKQISDIDDQIKKLERIENREYHAQADLALAEQGIDRRGNIVGSISPGASSIAGSAFGQFGIFGQKGVYSEGRRGILQDKLAADATPDGDRPKFAMSPTMMLIIGGAVALILMLKK